MNYILFILDYNRGMHLICAEKERAPEIIPVSVLKGLEIDVKDIF